MSVLVLRCPQCGADLDVGEGVEMLRCKFCGARSHVEGQGSYQHLTLIAKQLERLEGHASRTVSELEALRQQQAHGLASQHATDDAVRRAAAAQEAAAQEAAYAARLQTATHSAIIDAGQRWVEEQQTEKQQLLALRSRFRVWRVLAFLGFPVVLAVVLIAAVSIALIGGKGRPDNFGAILLLCSPLIAGLYSYVAWKVGTATGQEYNKRAYLHGLPDVRVKSKEEQEWEQETKRADNEWKKARSSSRRSGCATLVLLVLAVVVGGFVIEQLMVASGVRQSGPSLRTNAPAENEPASNSKTGMNLPPAGNPLDGQPMAPEPRPEHRKYRSTGDLP